MTDKLISDLVAIGAAVADNTVFEAQRSGQTTTEKAAGTDLTTYIGSKNLSYVADADAARINLGVGFGMPKTRIYYFTDCAIGPSSGILSDFWKGDWSGTAAQLTSVTVGAINAFGIYSLDLGTTTSGRASMSSSNAGCLKLGSGQSRFAARFAIHTLSTGTETYTARVGYIDSLTGESTDGVFFRYTDGVNSGKWQAVCRSNGTETATDTGVTAVADTFQRFQITVNAAGNSVTFLIDGANSVTTATNIPTGAGRETQYGVMALKSAGTTATSGGYLDYIEIDHQFTSSR